jgi:hypothetical protein
MHKLILITLFVLPHSLIAQRVEVEQYTRKLAEIVSLFESNIMNAKHCESLWQEVIYFKEEVDRFASNESLSKNDNDKLDALSKVAELYDDFFICVGGWTSFPIDQRKFFRAVSVYDEARVAYLKNYKFCVDVLEFDLGTFSAYLLVNNTPNRYTVSYNLENNGYRHTGEMGLTSGMVRIMISNRAAAISALKIVNITCQEF